jgi:RNA polymerase sigma-70 factor (sigma-E family)
VEVLRRSRGEDMEDRPLQRAAEHDVIRQIFETHHAKLVSFCFVLTGDSGQAQDLAQDVFVRVAERIPDLRGHDMWPYLRAAAVNLWRNRLRRLRLERRQAQAIESIANSDVPTARVDDHDAIWRAMSKLPRRQRSVLVLRYYEDLSEETAARILGCSVGTIKSQASRGLARLRKEIQDGP